MCCLWDTFGPTPTLGVPESDLDKYTLTFLFWEYWTTSCWNGSSWKYIWFSSSIFEWSFLPWQQDRWSLSILPNSVSPSVVSGFLYCKFTWAKFLLIFLLGEKCHRMPLRTCISACPGKNVSQNIWSTLRVTENCISQLSHACATTCLSKLQVLRFFFSFLLFKLCHLSLNSFTGWVARWKFPHSIPFLLPNRWLYWPCVSLKTVQHFHPLLDTETVGLS